jgi:hypothetical protein
MNWPGIVIGLAAGALAAWVYTLLLRKGVDSVLRKKEMPASFFGGYILRLVIFAGIGVLTIQFAGLYPFLAYAAAFIVTKEILVRRTGRTMNSCEEETGRV